MQTLFSLFIFIISHLTSLFNDIFDQNYDVLHNDLRYDLLPFLHHSKVTKLDNGIKAAVENGGADIRYIQGSYANLTLEKGAKYQLEFDYSANQRSFTGSKRSAEL